nr:DNA mismatch repair endonuclease MutL [Desulforamulus aquiferis]
MDQGITSIPEFFINKRYVKSGLVASVLQQVYQTQIPSGRFPIAVLHIDLDPTQVDVNVHPTKMEVRLAREKELAEELQRALSEPLSLPTAIPGLWEVLPSRTNPFKADQEAKSLQSSNGERMGPVKNEGEAMNFVKQMSLPSLKPPIDNMTPRTYEQKPLFETRKSSNSSGMYESVGSYEAAEVFPSLLPVGQFLPTYVLAQGTGGLYIIDQHAAHERVLYEKYQRQLATVESQILLEPITLNLPNHEVQLVIENILSFSELGFILEHFGGDTFLLRGIPSAAAINPGEIFLDLLSRLQEYSVQRLEPTMILNRLAAALACRDAIKAGQHMGNEEIRALLMGLAECQQPYTCPHGRPTLVNISHEEMNKRFKR